MRISDWSSDGCSSDLKLDGASGHQGGIHFHKHGTARGRATEAGLEQRPAEEIEIASFCATHRRQQRESGDIGVALCRDELDAAVEKFLFGVEHIEDVARADAVLGTNAPERALVCCTCCPRSLAPNLSPLTPGKRTATHYPDPDRDE